MMGPYSEEKQFQRATSIKRLLDDNPKLDPLYKAMWKKHLLNLALNETTYNYRVKNIYINMKPQNRGWINYE
jgi:ketopantoate reductase|tara:strand:+ start:1541 stop:1756 length:216 start_codon:yes stop_codon:yes gene_type:complete